MINFPEIDLKNEKIRVIFFVLSVMLFFFSQFEEKTLLSIIVIFIVINYYISTKNMIQDKVITKKSPLLLNYNNKIERLLKQIKKFKKRSPHNYKEGMYYWVNFMKNIDLLEDDTLHNYNVYFDNAVNYLHKSVNLFQSLGTEAEERQMIDATYYNDYIDSKELMNHTKTVQELYQESHEILYNLSLRLNEKWKENPHILNKEIVYLHPHPNDNFVTDQYDYYM
tara:strand:+ start:969 stop:1640 length:672 start_codon:yes stop_codon:yes gene_type:complete